jgi:hypothetical protein
MKNFNNRQDKVRAFSSRSVPGVISKSPRNQFVLISLRISSWLVWEFASPLPMEMLLEAPILLSQMDNAVMLF